VQQTFLEYISLQRSRYCLPLKSNHQQESKVTRKRVGRKEQKDSESTTSLSTLSKKRKPRSRNSTRNTEVRLRGDSSDPLIQNTLPSIKNFGQTLDLPPGKLKEQLAEVLSLTLKTRSSLTKFETTREAEEFEAELEKYLPKDIGVFIIREKEVNCYQITYRTKEDKQLDAITYKGIRNALYARFKDPKVEKEITRAYQRAYFAKKNKADKIKKRTPKVEDRRSEN